MIPYQTKSKKIAGSNLGEVYENSNKFYREISGKTKRRPYIRSAYFDKEKIFFDYFWLHLRQKHPKDRFHRLKYFRAACELIRYSRNGPMEKTELFEKKETWYRFSGLTAEKDLFYVQIKQDRRTRKYFMSCFSPKLK